MIDNNYNKQLDLLDVLNVLSFLIGLANYGENLTQGDKQDIMQEFDNDTKKLLDEIHAHLESQDNKLNEIQKRLEALNK
jgi:hypothetical protein